MQAIKCEVCGSNDILKQDGVFICQKCGCKYSLEDVRKLMVEESNDTANNISYSDDNLEQLKMLGDAAYDRGDDKEAFKYYSKIVERDTNDYERKFKWLITSIAGMTLGELEKLDGPVFKLSEYIDSLNKDENISDNEKKEKIVWACRIVNNSVNTVFNFGYRTYMPHVTRVLEEDYLNYLNFTLSILEKQKYLLSYESNLLKINGDVKKEVIYVMDNMITELLSITKRYQNYTDANKWHWASDKTIEKCYDLSEYILGERRKLEPEYKLPKQLVPTNRGGSGAQQGLPPVEKKPMSNGKKMMLFVFTALALLIAFVVIKDGYDSREARYRIFAETMDKNYKAAVTAMENSKSSYYDEKELTSWSVTFNKFDNPLHSAKAEIDDFGRDRTMAVLEKYPDGRWLSKYVHALSLYCGTSTAKQIYRTNAEMYEAAVKAINEIPDDYNGVLANKIKEDKKAFRNKAIEAGALLQAAQDAHNAELHIGDPETKIEEVYGPPIKIKRDISATVEHNQYVYDDKFIYADNGRVTAFQNR